MANGNGSGRRVSIFTGIDFACLLKKAAPFIGILTTAILVTVFLLGRINTAQARADQVHFENQALRRELTDIKGELRYIRERLDDIWKVRK